MQTILISIKIPLRLFSSLHIKKSLRIVLPRVLASLMVDTFYGALGPVSYIMDNLICI